MNLLYNRIPRIQQALKPLKLSDLRAFFKSNFLLVFILLSGISYVFFGILERKFICKICI